MKFHLVSLVCAIALLFSSVLIPQVNDLRFDQYTADHGLSQNQVFCIYSDSKEFLWLGTQDGLNLFDGYSFKVFKHEPGNQNSLSDYAVNAICESDTGIFWIGTMSGLDRFDLKTETFKHFKTNPAENSLVDNTIWRLYKDNSENIWIATSGGLSKYNPKSDLFTNYKFDTNDKYSLSNNFILSITQDDSGNMWIGNRGGLDYLDQKKNLFYRNIINPENPTDVYSNGVLSCLIYNDRLFVGTYSGLYSTNLTVNKDENKIFELVYKDHTRRVGISKIIKGSNGVIWFTTTGEGLFRYNPASGEIFNYKKSDSKYSLSDNYLLTAFEDLNGVLWVGTNNSGLNKHSTYSEQFITYNLPKTARSIAEDLTINSIFIDKKRNLFLGTITGLIAKSSSLSSINESISYLNDNKSFITPNRYPEISSIKEDKEGKIWITTFGNGVYLYDPLSNRFTFLKYNKNNPNSLSNNFTHIVLETKDGTIWIGTGAGGLNKYDKLSGTFSIYKNDPPDSNSLSSNEIIALCEDEEGFLWIGTTNKGLNKFNPKTNQVKRYIHDPEDLNSIASNRINSLFIDSRKQLWIGTYGGGLNKWIEKENKFKHFTINEGLGSNIIQTILEDNQRNLWLSTNKGISMFNPETEIFKNYDINDGLQGNDFLRNAGFSDHVTGNLYFSGVNGLNIFNPSKLHSNQRKSKIVITNFKIFNKDVKIKGSNNPESPLAVNIIYADKIVLPYEDNFISFEFASLDFNNPEKNQYAYKMEGFNQDWIFSGNQRFVTYTNLDAGTYTFHVKGTNGDGVWNEDGTFLQIVILPPWWKTWWAYLIYGAAVIAIFLFIRQFELKRVKLRNELEIRDLEAKKLQEVDKLKSRFFANISHEFRTPLTLVLGLTDKFLKKAIDINDKKDLGVIRKNANKLLHLINQLLELSKLEAGNINLKVSKYDINKFLRRILASFTSLLEQKNLSLIFNGCSIDELAPQKEVFLYIDPEKFETIIYNLISNAIKFTPGGEKIEVEVTQHLHSVDLRFTNTGIGIPQDKIPFIFNRFYQADETTSRNYEGTGIGLALVKELVELHNGEIKVLSIEGKETTFEIKLPVGRANYKPEQIVEIPVGDEKEIRFANAALSDSFLDEITNGKDKTKVIVADTRAKIILVVEDNFDLRNYITEQLENDYTIFEAEDGEKGLKLAGEVLPDLIISDVMMPKMDGYEMCRRIKKDFKSSHIPIIMLTAKAAKDDKLEGLEIGADDYLVKPFDSDELLIRVKNLIRIRDDMKVKFRSEMLLKPREVIVPSSEKIFMEKLSDILEQKIENEKFGVDELSKEIGLSRSQLHRKLKAISDQSTTEFIRNFRLNRAADLILQNAGNMAEIAYKVGFGSQAYFNKSFLDFFGCSPGEYRKKNNS